VRHGVKPRTGWDIFVAAFLLLLLPLFAIAAFAIKLDSRGPILFVQERMGFNKRRFRMFKFRTMREGALPYDYSPRAAEDPRITRVGRFLRRTSLDELPQLLNVVNGSMSLVGPRPEWLRETKIARSIRRS